MPFDFAAPVSPALSAIRSEFAAGRSAAAGLVAACGWGFGVAAFRAAVPPPGAVDLSWPPLSFWRGFIDYLAESRPSHS